MYVDSFVLTREQPQANPKTGEVSLGAAIQGIFTPFQFPTPVNFGVYVELAFDPEEHGTFHVELRVSEVLIQPRYWPLESFSVEMPAASEDWYVPRLVPLSFYEELEVTSEGDLLVWVFVDDRAYARKPIVVRGM